MIKSVKIKTEIINLNTDESMFYPYSIKINNAKAVVIQSMTHVLKYVFLTKLKTNVKVFNLLSRTNETRHIKWYKSCKCTCRLDASICNNKQRWNDGKCRCECKELIDKGMCDKGFIWNTSNWDCEYDKSCDIGEYLDYINCRCRKKIIDKLVEECSENIDGNEIIYNETLGIISSSNNKTCDSCVVNLILFSAFLIISISMAIYVYFFLYLKDISTNSHYFGCLNINGN